MIFLASLSSYRDFLSSLERRINIVERAVFKSANPNSSTPSYDSGHSHFKTPTTCSEAMKLSDLDISPVSGRSSNPLYSLRTQEEDGSNDGSFSGGALEEEDDERERSDLDGHTLSCSLELMSDLEGGWNCGRGSPLNDY